MATALFVLLSKLFQKLVDTATTPVRAWNGDVEIVNPTTGQKTGKFRKTFNLDFNVSKDIYEQCLKWRNLEDKGGNWVEITIFSKRMVMIDCRESKKADTINYIVQFAVPTQSSWEEIGKEEFKETFMRLFAEANTITDTSTRPAKPSETKESLKGSVDEQFERLMNAS